MNKHEFLNSLEKQLASIPVEDRRDILTDYSEHFRAGLENGRSESEIEISLGNPKTIAKEIKADYMVHQVDEKLTVTNFFNAFVATVGLGFFNLVFILGPFIAIWSAILSLIIGSISFVFSGLLIMVGPIMEPIFPEHFNIPVHGTVAFFSGLAFIALGSMLTILTIQLHNGFIKLTIKYLKGNINIIANRRDQK